MEFGLISEITIDPKTWRDKIFITIDIDWAHDDIIIDTLSIVENFEIPVTFFSTHNSELIDSLTKNEKYEIGIHPNFNFLLHGEAEYENTYEKVIDKLMHSFPNATAVRSHSLAQSGPIQNYFSKSALTHDCNDMIPEYSGIKLCPWESIHGMLKVPYCWADEHAWKSEQTDDFSKILNTDGLVVFNFHPIHIFLNTENLQRYESTRSEHVNPKSLIRKRFNGFGTRSRFINLLDTR